jgi:hypothetical protein
MSQSPAEAEQSREGNPILFAKILFCASPVFALASFVLLLWFVPDRILPGTLPVSILIFFALVAVSLSFMGYFSIEVPNALTWPTIIAVGVLVISLYAALYLRSGVLCDGAVKSGCLEVPEAILDGYLDRNSEGDLIIPADEVGKNPIKIHNDVPNALYFSIVTFTTLGYGDMQPIPKMRIVAASQALVGYAYLGLIVATLFHWASERFTSIEGGYCTVNPVPKQDPPDPALDALKEDKGTTGASKTNKPLATKPRQPQSGD